MASSSSTSAARLCALSCRRATPRVRQLRRARPHTTPSPTLTSTSTSSSKPFITSCSRGLHTSRPLRDDKGAADRADGEAHAHAHAQLDLKMMNRAFAESITPEGLRQLDELAKSNGHATVDGYLEAALRETPGWGSEDRALEEELHRDDVGEKPNKSSFWYDEDDPEMITEEHDEFDEDDITSMAHAKLDEVREMRHYARLAVWEMPLLSKLAKKFEPPARDQVLRWRYTTYMGEQHPAEKKVVVQFAPADLGLTDAQALKLKKLAGARYDPDTQLVKMSCEGFEHQAQNKAYLARLVGALVARARDGADMFDDVPLDTRHRRSAPKPRFPPAWRMTEGRRRELEEGRRAAALEDLGRAEAAGGLVDGQKRIDDFLMQRVLEEQAKERERAEELVAAPVYSKPAGGRR